MPRRSLSYSEAAYVQPSVGGVWQDARLATRPETIRDPSPEAVAEAMSAVDSVKARDTSKLGLIEGVPAQKAWEALIAPKPRQQMAPTMFGVDDCIKDKWMPVVHPGLLAGGEYEGKSFIPERHVPRPTDHEFKAWLRDPEMAACYEGRLKRAEVACHNLGVRRTVLNQYIYQNAAQPGVLSGERHGVEATRPYTSWLYPFASNASLKGEPLEPGKPGHVAKSLQGLVKPTEG